MTFSIVIKVKLTISHLCEDTRSKIAFDLNRKKYKQEGKRVYKYPNNVVE